ncbi:MAG: hypothetical protein L6455_10070 [Kiritimatiellae bacterium]|nr:hypothetical protein [Verrucomicrobiota bacterium]MBU4291900.1 hypothetical protein [Verrucomicrobiota bacterium]MCG2680295.1 hypothetical protein [Kiritimatiellia bacterium]
MKRYLFLVQLLLASTTWATTDLPSGVSVDFSYNAGALLGSNLVWTVVLVNRTNTTRTCRLIMDADVLQYNGEHVADLVTQITTNTLAPNTTNIVNVTVTPAMYTKWTGVTYTFELHAALRVEGQNDRWNSSGPGLGRIVMRTSRDIISVTPTPPIPQGQSLTATVRYLNPLPGSLHNVEGYMTARGLNGTNNTRVESSWDIGTVESNAWITLSTNYVAGQVGTHNISFFITAKELKAVKGWIPVEVIAPQLTLEAQVTLKPEALNVNPGLLTAFVRMPEGYPVSGITSATCDGAPSERMMLNEDETEMIIKFRRKDIEAALAQTGESLDTNFVVRGTWQGAAGTRLFQGADSIKKIVGAKKKEEKK